MIVEWRDLVGIPYSFLGRDECGASCMWVPLEIHRRAGHLAEDPLIDPEAAALQWDVVENGPWEVLDVVWIDTKGTGVTGHAGCVVEPGLILHATRDRGIVTVPLDRVQGKILFGSRWKQQPTN